MENEGLMFGLQLLAAGMITVFAILFVVVGIGNALIAFVNKFIPEEEKSEAAAKTNRQTTSIDPKKVAAISSAVSIVTQGKGKVVNIEKC